MDIKLIATTGRAQGQAVEIRASKFFIGRHENCQLRPDIKGLAGIHALLEQRELKLFLRDFGAEGGTGINDRVLHARETEVFNGDLVQIGPMVLTIAIRPKGEISAAGHLHAPDGWPFLELASDAPMPAPPAPKNEAHVPPAPHQAPARAEPFLPSRPAPRTEPIAAAAVATSPTMVAPALPPLKPILPRPVGRRALDCQMVDDVMVVTILAPDLNEEETVSPVRYELRSLLDEEKVPSRMVIDMGNTRYLSSRAVGVLLAHYQGLERKGATMRVCRVSKEIKPVLDQMRLSMLIDIYPSVEEAVHSSWE